jgi:disulfide bond formation protein DsbB
VFTLGAIAVIGAALGFEHLGGYQPCALCLQQRTPYYLAIPVGIVLLAALYWRPNRRLIAFLFAVAAGLMLYDAGLAAYHAGVEWRFWEGPAACAPTGDVGSAASMLEALGEGQHAPSCTDATWHFLGLSFAGWNAILASGLGVLAAFGAMRAYGSRTASQ